jgi:peptidoglycan hydrolase-like protein with peptidoglycan-binding domain
MRTLQLTNPLMTGDDVKQVQQLLAKNGYSPGTIDSQYGPATANAVQQAKFGLGYPQTQCDTVCGPKLVGYLQGQPVPADYQKRQADRQKATSKGSSIRDALVAFAQWGITNEPQIHYQQLRPMDGIGKPKKLPLQTDCSGFVTLCYNWAGGPDPNGTKFNGQGYTGTMLQACKHIAKSAAQPGDLVIWGPPPGNHVAMVIEAGADPLLVSHGQEKGPIAIKFSVETKYQPTPVTWLSIL